MAIVQRVSDTEMNTEIMATVKKLADKMFAIRARSKVPVYRGFVFNKDGIHVIRPPKGGFMGESSAMINCFINHLKDKGKLDRAILFHHAWWIPTPGPLNEAERKEQNELVKKHGIKAHPDSQCILIAYVDLGEDYNLYAFPMELDSYDYAIGMDSSPLAIKGATIGQSAINALREEIPDGSGPDEAILKEVEDAVMSGPFTMKDIDFAVREPASNALN